LTSILETESSTETSILPQKKVETNQLKNIKNYVSNLELDIKDMQDDLENLSIDLDDDIGRMSYVRQLTGEFLEYLLTLNDELKKQVDIPQSEELMNKILGRAERKRYYMSKFRL